MSVSLHYKMERMSSLRNVLKSADFPIVARLYDTQEIAGKNLIEGKEVLFQRQMKVKYAQVKVLDFNNKDEIQEEKGVDFIMEHDNYVGNKFLIPSKYTASLKFIHRPGSWKRFASISQVLHELPRFVLVGEETVVSPSNGIGKNVIIPAKTVIELVKKFTVNGITYLECNDGYTSFSFSETDRVNFTAVEDEKYYHMYELVRMKLLPRPFQFKDVEPEDVIHLNEELNSGVLTVAEGPLDLMKFIDIDIVVGWLRDSYKKTYKTFIIPSRLWPVTKLETTSFPDRQTKDAYIESWYNKCVNTDFVEKKLYEMSEDEKITWLASPDFFERRYSGNCMFKVVAIGYIDSGDDEDDDTYSDMFDCPPPIPDRPTHIPPNLPPRVKEKATIFAKVHKELLKWVMPQTSKQRNISNENLKLQAGVSGKDEHSNNYKKPQTDGAMKGDKGRYLHPIDNSAHQVQSNMDISMDLLRTESLSSFEVSSESDSDTSESESSSDHDYVEPETFEYPDKPELHVQSVEVQPYNYYTEPEEIDSDVADDYEDIPMKESPAVMKSSDCLASSNDNPLLSFERNGHIPNDSTSSIQSREILKPTEEEFYQYSVSETSQCFKLCGITEFAEQCNEYKLDGSFFRQFDLQTLREDPFNFTSFQILKIKKIIFEGWRPKIDHRN